MGILTKDMKAYRKKYYLENKEKLKENRRIKYLRNKEKELLKVKEYRINNPHMIRAKDAARRAWKLKANPFGSLYRKVINDIYKNCPEGHHVDHIVPLKSNEVCGLHVPWNLQYLPAEVNIKKGNKILTTYIDNITSLTVSSDINYQAANEDCHILTKQVPNA